MVISTRLYKNLSLDIILMTGMVAVEMYFISEIRSLWVWLDNWKESFDLGKEIDGFGVRIAW